jgi:multiple sugar transport system substrate-binding protein
LRDISPKPRGNLFSKEKIIMALAALHSPNPRARIASLIAVAGIAAVALAGCSPAASSTSSKPDNGTSLTMWARTGDLPKPLVDAYNKTHKNQIKLTIVPGDSYQQKVGAAAGANALPDLLAADVVYSPNYVKQGLYQDITNKVKALSFYKDLTPAHSKAASKNGKIYGTPFIVDSSLIIYNKTLFKQAGLDPEAAPKNFDDVYNDAKAIRALGGKTYGFYFGGNCAGCNAYDMMAIGSAAGTPAFQDDGTKASIDNPAMNATLALYKKMWDEGIIPSAAKTEDGSTWPASFNAGQIGILPIGNFNFGALAKAKFDWGIAPLPAPDGSASSTFVGGDVIGITKNSKHLDQAFDFIKWELSEKAQVDIIAKSGNLPARVDLADNEFSSKDPRVVATIKGLANGYTPSATEYGTVINDSTGPWLTAIRDYIFNGNTGSLTVAQKAIQSDLDSAN